MLAEKLKIRYRKQKKNKKVKNWEFSVPKPSNSWDSPFRDLIHNLGTSEGIKQRFFEIQKIDTDVWKRMLEMSEIWKDEDEENEEEGGISDEEDKQLLLDRFEILVDYIAKCTLPVKVLYISTDRGWFQTFFAWYFCDYGASHLGLKVGKVTLEWGIPGPLGTDILIPLDFEKVDVNLVGSVDTIHDYKSKDIPDVVKKDNLEREKLILTISLCLSALRTVRFIFGKESFFIQCVKMLIDLELKKVDRFVKVVEEYNQKYKWGKFGKYNCQGFTKRCLRSSGLKVDARGELREFINRITEDSRDGKLMLYDKEIKSRRQLYEIVERKGWRNICSYDKSYILSLKDVIDNRVKMFYHALDHEDWLICIMGLASRVREGSTASRGSIYGAAASAGLGVGSVAAGMGSVGGVATASVTLPVGAASTGTLFSAATVVAGYKVCRHGTSLKKLVGDLTKAVKKGRTDIAQSARKRIKSFLEKMIEIWKELDTSLDRKREVNWVEVWEDRRKKSLDGMQRITNSLK